MTPYRERREAGEFDGDDAVASPDLDDMTKAELSARAADLGIEVEAGWTKADLRAAIEAAG